MALAAVAGLIVGLVSAIAYPHVAAAATNQLTLRVEDAQTQDPISQYKFLVNRTDSGDPTQPRLPGCMPNGNDPSTDYPTGCDWPSVRLMTGGAGGEANVIAQGDEGDLDQTTGLNLPNGDYLISVTSPSYKIDGAHFSVPLSNPGLVTVSMNPDPHPLATVKIQVFDDSMTNGQYDPQSEDGLQGFTGHVEDVLGEVTTDWFGNPLCAEYDTNGDYVPGTGGACRSDAAGLITIPNLGPNRYEVTAVPPDGQPWVQTTTLEGGHTWDSWAFEGWDGLDNELLVNGAPVPWVQAGFVLPTTVSGGTAHLKGRAVSVKSYLPPAGGDTLEGPVSRAWISITDLLDNDRMIYAGRTGTDGTFDIGGLPGSSYQVSYWDQDQNLLLQSQNVVVDPGQTVDIGDLQLSHWFSEIHGTVFLDTNKNGKRDAGEQPLKGQPVALKSRDNSLVDAFSRSVVTDANGNYVLKQVYPYGYWTVLEVYNDRFYTTGVTYQADNQPDETTVLGAGVDIATLNQDGLNSRIDWGVQPYTPGSNGGIVGTVVYNLTRNELDPRLAATEDYEPGIPDLQVKLYRPVDADNDGQYDANPNGALTRGPQIGEYTTETFERPTDCQARDAGGNPIDLEFAPPATGGFECLESPLMGDQIQTGFSTVNGNYGFGTVWRLDNAGNPVRDGNGDIVEDPMPAGDYLVAVEVPDDASGTPKYKVTREEDVNVFDGSDFTPQVPPPPCAGALHTVDVKGVGADGANATDNPTFADVGGSPYEGDDTPLCDTKLITVNDQRSIAPSFHYFTDVPQPGRLFGAVVEDLMLGTDPKEFYYGEKAGIPNAPIGVYDYTGKLVLNTQADPNGFFDILLPSTNTFNCPLPAGPCPNMYRVVGNDPGTPERPNPTYDPQYRSFATWWQIWPGLSLLADVALLPTASIVETPGTTNTHPPACKQVAGTPQLFAVDKPYVNGSGSMTIQGQDFGTAGTVSLGGNPATVNSWTDRTINVTIPAGTPVGPHQLSVKRADNGRAATNALTIHVLGTGYSPTVYEVGPEPGRDYATVQGAIDAASGDPRALVVVYPNTAYTYSPLGDYFENVVMHTPVKLQGVGPGGIRGDGSSVKGSILNGTGFATTRADAWSTLVESLKSSPGWDGNQNVYDGQVVYVVAKNNAFTSGYRASVDGFSIEGGNEFGNEGTYVTPNYVTQGGGIFVNAYAKHLQVSNNVIRGNGGNYGGGVRVGTPYVGDNHNDDLRIAHNRIIANGGSNLAGGVGLFAGSNGYEVDHNDICGNFSAEYGGGISHFGLSGDAANPGRTHHNQIWDNSSYDEGAGVMVAGEVTPTNDNQVSPGSGPVSIHDNLVQSNLAEDDGGGLRFLQAGTTTMSVFNNMIVNNISAHEGGGVAIDDATDVRFVNNTVMKNISTSTSATSDGNPVPAGLASSANSAQLQATLPAGAKTFSDPLLFNNVFWDNRAGGYDFDADQLTGIGLPGDSNPPNVWDLGILDQSGRLSPTSSILTKSDPTYVNADTSNKVGTDPKVLDRYDTVIRTLPWRGNPQTVFSITVSVEQPPTVKGDYHLDTGSPAANSGVAARSGTSAPDHDIDDENRPSGAGFEIGADEYPVVPDTTGPLSSAAAVAPSPTNNTGTVTLTAMADDSTTGNSNIAAAEWFAGTDPGQGSGHAMAATDGAFDEVTEAVRATAGLNALPQGDNTIKVRGKDAANNWGATTSVVLHVDTTAPSMTAAAATPSSVPKGTPATLTGSATDSGTGNRLARAEWFEGTDPGVGNATAMTATDGAFDQATEAFRATVTTTGMTVGTHTLRLRARDAAGNWSATRSTTLVVTTATPVIFADGFENGTTSRWSVVNSARLAVTATAAMRGTTRGLRVLQGTSITYVQDATPAFETVYTARFWFNPNSSRTDADGHPIFLARNASGLTFDLQFKHPTTTSAYQVRITERRNTGTVLAGAWVTVSNVAAAYEIAWRAGTSTTTTLKVAGVQRSALVANTSGRNVDSVRMGALYGVGAGAIGYQFFDEFVSTRGTAVGP